MRARPLIALTLAPILAGSFTWSTAGTAQTMPLAEAKLIIEHNATDEDTGFQAFIDGEGWHQLDITGPSGIVLSIEGRGTLGELGLTELFFESVEPDNADVSIADVLSAMPEGRYEISGPAIEAGDSTGRMFGTALLTHTIPAGPQLLTPTADAVVPASDLLISWEPVAETISGAPLSIVGYQLVIEKDGEPHPNIIGKWGLSVYVPASVTSLTVPAGFLEPATGYDWEVLAIEESGNQTLSASAFRTE